MLGMILMLLAASVAVGGTSAAAAAAADAAGFVFTSVSSHHSTSISQRRMRMMRPTVIRSWEESQRSVMVVRSMSSTSSPTPPNDDNKRDGDANAANSKYSSSSTTERQEEEILGPLADANKTSEEAAGTIVDGDEDQVAAASGASAMTGTVNERLMAELQQAVETEKYGARSSMGQKMGLAGSSSSRFRPFSSRKTDQERQAAVEEARNLNGVNPVVTLVGSMVALAIAAGLWTLTQWLAEYFALHPIESDLYVVNRVTAVFRNVVMGLVSLASGFFGVTGVGIFLLGVRVAYGVVTGELDPTPIVRKKTTTNDEPAVDLGSAWDLMTNKNQKRGRR